MNTTALSLFEYTQWAVVIGAALFVAWRRYKKQPWLHYCLLIVALLAAPFCLALAAPALIYTPLVNVLGFSTALVRQTLLNLAGLAGLTAVGGMVPIILIGVYNILTADTSDYQNNDDTDEEEVFRHPSDLEIANSPYAPIYDPYDVWTNDNS